MGGRHAAAILESHVCVCEVAIQFLFLMGKGPLGEHQPRSVLADSTIRLLMTANPMAASEFVLLASVRTTAST